ncbi:DDE-type integrase/transposase/recombinase [Rhizobium lusitanum]|nr:DDE-type integrase/transposase/recombinase [Rhizobium lusitanum]
MKHEGRWVYLHRAVDKHGDTIDLYLSQTRNAKAGKRFPDMVLAGFGLGKATEHQRRQGANPSDCDRRSQDRGQVLEGDRASTSARIIGVMSPPVVRLPSYRSKRQATTAR